MITKEEACAITTQKREVIEKTLAKNAYTVGNILIDKAIRENAEKGSGTIQLWFSSFDSYSWIKDDILVKYQGENSNYNCGVCSDLLSFTDLKKHLEQHDFSFSVVPYKDKTIALVIKWVD
ncbi:MAG: hypothetical protein IJ150_05855 [Bacteroidales bacterium]|nr:hypothetical protein [Bacteroidales bacterium]